MIIDFKVLLNDDYELFLPMPVFSKKHIELTIEKDVNYTGAIGIENIGEGLFSAQIEEIGHCLRLEEPVVYGNDSAIIYTIDTTGYAVNDCIKTALLLTYLGGEQKIEFVINIKEEPRLTIMKETEQKPTITHKKHKNQPLYKINLNKKAYRVDEPARFVVVNNDIYPITIKVLSENKALMVQEKIITINDIGFMDIYLRKGFFNHAMRKYKNSEEPIIHQSVTLEITSESGKEVIEQALIFTTYSSQKTTVKIESEVEYKKNLIQIQKLYCKFLLNRERNILKKVRRLIESAMNYHLTDINLRLIYILVLIDLNKLNSVNDQVSQLLKYQNYYEERGREEYTDIIKVLYEWLKGGEVEEIINEWTLTTYRQLYKNHIFTKQTTTFLSYEKLYLAGVKTSYLCAETVYLMNHKPIVPLKKSVFYRFILRWAINKNALSNNWIESIENGYYQIVKNHLLDGHLCFNLYTIKPSLKILRLLCAILVKEDCTNEKAHAIYYEILRSKEYVKDVAIYYVHAAYKNRLMIDVKYIQLSIMNQIINHDEKVYLYLQYMDSSQLNQNTIRIYKRLYNEFVEICVHKDMTEDEGELIANEVQLFLYKHQWKEVKCLLKKEAFERLLEVQPETVREIISYGAKKTDFEWLEAQLEVGILAGCMSDETLMKYSEYLVEVNRYQDIYILFEHNYLDEIKEDLMADIFAKEDIHNRNRQYNMALYLYGKGNRSLSLLKILAKDYVADLKDMIQLFYDMLVYDDVLKALMEKIMYRGVWIRNHQEQVFLVYRYYRREHSDSAVIEVMNRYFAAQILIESRYGPKELINIFEEDLYKSSNQLPIGLALLSLYKQYGEKNELISKNIIKNSVKNGIIFPWYADMAIPYLEASKFRKATFFSYHSKSNINVSMYYRADDQKGYTKLTMKHVAFGLYIGYIIVFYHDYISYYYEEERVDGVKEITESDLYSHEQFIEPIDNHNIFDIINTIMMSQVMDDGESVDNVMEHYIELRKGIRENMEIL